MNPKYTYIINNEIVINDNGIIIKPLNLTYKTDYYITISDTGAISSNITIEGDDKISSFIFSNGSKPQKFRPIRSIAYHESKLSPDIKINNTTMIG
jgi:hypothetical protein